FIVHAPHGESDEAAVRQLSTLPSVELIKLNFKHKDDYFEQIYRVHAVLLPYDPIVYAVRTSGIFIEALGLGRPVITTSGTWMARQLCRRPEAGLTMSSYSSAALCECLELARNRVLQNSWKPNIAHDIIGSNTARAFCGSVIAAMER